MEDVDVDWGLDDDGYNDDCLSLGGYDDAIEEQAPAPAVEAPRVVVKEDEPRSVVKEVKKEETEEKTEDRKQERKEEVKELKPVARTGEPAVAASSPTPARNTPAATHAPRPTDKPTKASSLAPVPVTASTPASQPALDASPQSERRDDRKDDEHHDRDRDDRDRDRRGSESNSQTDTQLHRERSERADWYVPGAENSSSQKDRRERGDRWLPEPPRPMRDDLLEEKRERDRRRNLEKNEWQLRDADGYHLKGAFQQPLHNSADGLPVGWRRIVPDKAFREGIRVPPADRFQGTGRYFYRHEESGVNQWEKPSGPPKVSKDDKMDEDVKKDEGREEERKEKDDDKPAPKQEERRERLPPTGPAATRVAGPQPTPTATASTSPGSSTAPPTGPRATRGPNSASTAWPDDEDGRRGRSDGRRDRDDDRPRVDGRDESGRAAHRDAPRRDTRDSAPPASNPAPGPRMNDARAALLNGRAPTPNPVQGREVVPPRGGRFGPGPGGRGPPVPGRFGHGPPVPAVGPRGRGMRPWGPGSGRAQQPPVQAAGRDGRGGAQRDREPQPRDVPAQPAQPDQTHNEVPAQSGTTGPTPPRRSEEAEALRAQLKERRNGKQGGDRDAKAGEKSAPNNAARDDCEGEKRKRDDNDDDRRGGRRRDSRQPDQDRGFPSEPAQPPVHPSRRPLVDTRPGRPSAPPRSSDRPLEARSRSPGRRSAPAPREPVPDLASRLGARPESEPRGDPDRKEARSQDDRNARDEREKDKPKERERERPDLASRLTNDRDRERDRSQRGRDDRELQDRRERADRWAPRHGREISPVTRQSPERGERAPASRSPEREQRTSTGRSPERAPPIHPARAALVQGSSGRPPAAPVSPLRQPRGPPPDAAGIVRPDAPAYGPNARRGDLRSERDSRDSRSDRDRRSEREEMRDRSPARRTEPQAQASAPAYGPNAPRAQRRGIVPNVTAPPVGRNAPGRWPSASGNGGARSPPPHLDRERARGDRYEPRDDPERRDERDKPRSGRDRTPPREERGGWREWNRDPSRERGLKRPLEGDGISGRMKRARSPPRRRR